MENTNPPFGPTVTPAPQPQHGSGRGKIVIAVIAVLIVALATAAWYFWPTIKAKFFGDEQPPSISFTSPKFQGMLSREQLEGNPACQLPGITYTAADVTAFAAKESTLTDMGMTKSPVKAGIHLYTANLINSGLNMQVIKKLIVPVEDNVVTIAYYSYGKGDKTGLEKGFYLYPEISGNPAAEDDFVIPAHQGFVIISCLDTEIYSVTDETKNSRALPDALQAAGIEDSWILTSYYDNFFTDLNASPYEISSVWQQKGAGKTSVDFEQLEGETLLENGYKMLWVKTGAVRPTPADGPASEPTTDTGKTGKDGAGTEPGTSTSSVMTLDDFIANFKDIVKEYFESNALPPDGETTTSGIEKIKNRHIRIAAQKIERGKLDATEEQVESALTRTITETIQELRESSPDTSTTTTLPADINVLNLNYNAVYKTATIDWNQVAGDPIRYKLTYSTYGGETNELNFNSDTVEPYIIRMPPVTTGISNSAMVGNLDPGDYNFSVQPQFTDHNGNEFQRAFTLVGPQPMDPLTGLEYEWDTTYGKAIFYWSPPAQGTSSHKNSIDNYEIYYAEEEGETPQLLTTEQRTDGKPYLRYRLQKVADNYIGVLVHNIYNGVHQFGVVHTYSDGSKTELSMTSFEVDIEGNEPASTTTDGSSATDADKGGSTNPYEGATIVQPGKIGPK